jgi:hypothetical protein
MDFIERLFGVSPDGGDGSFELFLFVLPLAAAVLLYRSGVAGRLLARRRRGS